MADQKCNGRATRRHPNCDAHYEAVAKYQAYHGKDARRKAAAERLEAREKLGPMEQLKELDRRLGKGVGARKERARLQALLDSLLEEKNRLRKSKKETA